MVAEQQRRRIQSSLVLAPPHPPPPPPLPSMAIQMAPSLLASLLLMLFLLLLLLFLACRPWRFFRLRRLRLPAPNKSDDLERPLFSDGVNYNSGQSYGLPGNNVEESGIRIDGNISSPSIHGLVPKKRVPSTDFLVNQGASLALDVVFDASDDLHVGQTLKRPAVSTCSAKEKKHIRTDAILSFENLADDARNQVSSVKDIGLQRSSLTLEVISGPSRGLCCSWHSKDSTMLPLTIGRVSPCDLILKDSEVSGKHALINWNVNKSKWELVDMGSLNGTLLNSQAIHASDSGSRHWSEPVELKNGDVITLGTSSKVCAQVTLHLDQQIPFGIGMASDPMSMRRGGKAFPMEDMCYCQWPIPGVHQFGLFAIFDGHGGAGASKAASKLLPENVANILSDPDNREKVFSLCDASDVLRDAFSLTEAAMNHQYEGCTATVLLLWLDHNKEFFAQCANVGDSACFMSVNGKQINMTEDHRITSLTERARMIKIGMPLKDGETRLCGINLGRMLGDKFLKEQDVRFSSEPYVSQVIHITKACTAFAILASDGLWDVISMKKVLQLVLQDEGIDIIQLGDKTSQVKERENSHDGNSAERIANLILSEARALRTKDNTSIIILDFDSIRIDSISNS